MPPQSPDPNVTPSDTSDQAPMRLRLRRLPATILGIYGPNRNQLPERMRYLHPAACDAYMRLEGTPHRLRVSDMLRSAESSLHASTRERGAQRPAFSGHNYGFSIDIDVKDCMNRWQMSKCQLDVFMASQGWFCHRKDHVLAAESWHYSFFSTGEEAQKYLAACARSKSTAAGLEAKIQDHYGAAMNLSAVQVQAALRRLRMYAGALDGAIGPLSRQGILAFQRAWALPPTGHADTITQRTLAFVAADLVIE